MKCFIIVLLILVCITLVNSASVLMLTHLQGSHVAELSTIGVEMARRGHKVYTILPQTSKHVSLRKKGIRVLTFPAKEEDMFMESTEFNDFISKKSFEGEEEVTIDLTIEVTTRHCKMMLEDVNLIKQVKEIPFDIAIVDSFPLDYCLLILPELLSVPIVSAFSSMNFWEMGVPALPSFVPSVFEISNDKLSFIEKLQAAYMHILFSSKYFPFTADTDLLNKYLKHVYSWNELLRKSVLFLQFRDEILEPPKPRMPNTIYLPGITYSPAKKLPTNIEKVYKQTNKGVVVVSFGSTAGFLPLETMNKFMSVFGKMKEYGIVWKFPLDKLGKNIHIPSNVHMFEWLPQNDCLGHKKTVLFITHCGNNGQHESVYHGVPMLGFPLFAEQPSNAFRIKTKGFGLYLDIKHFEEADLEMAINEILNNETIAQNVHKFSSILKQRQHPKEEAVYWIEHVIKFGGSHLRGASMDMPWYQLLMFDILALIILVVSIIVGFCFFICKYMFCRMKIKHKTQ